MTSDDRPDAPPLVVHSEFALALLTVDRGANGDRLHLLFPRSGTEAYVDPLELELLIASRRSNCAALVQESMP